SMAPLMTLFSNQGGEIPLVNDTIESLFYTTQLNATVAIDSVESFVSYVDFAQTENKTYVDQIIGTIDVIDNYTLEVYLDSHGRGYEYDMRVYPENFSDAEEIGFKLKVYLDRFFSSKNTPLVVANIRLPGEGEGINGTVIISDNNSQEAMLLYSSANKNDAFVTCTEAKVVKSTNILAQITGLCYQPVGDYIYGLSFADFLRLEETVEVEKMMTPVPEYYEIKGISENATVTELHEKLPNCSISKEQSAISIKTLDLEDSSLDNVTAVFDELGIVLIQVYKVEKYELEPTILHSGKTYNLWRDYVSIRLPEDYVSGVKKVKFSYVIIFDEVVDAVAEVE
ncbi:MAG: hypothetical protein V1911_02400, partial [Candidatus Micrarchaeota archaeon]